MELETSSDTATVALVAEIDFQRIFESCPHPYLILRADDGFTIAAVSERYLAVTGTQRETLIGRGLFDAFPNNPDDPSDTGTTDLAISLERVLRDKAQDVMGVQRYDVPSADGFQVKYWSPVNTPVFDRGGAIPLIIHHVEDVTEFVQMRERHNADNADRGTPQPDRMQAEVLLRAREVKEANQKLKAAQKTLELREQQLAQLNESLERRVSERTLELQASNERLAGEIEARTRAEQRFQSLFEFAPSATLLTDRHGVIEMVNAQVEQVFNYSKAELLGRPVDLLVPERLHAQHAQLRAAFHGAPAPRPLELERTLYGIRKDGSEFPLEIALNPIETSEGTKVLAAVVDIQDRKQKEDSIKSSLKEKVTLLSEIHHRVKNNLQIISSLLDLQSMQIDDPTAHAMLQSSMNRIQSMALIHQTLYQSTDFSLVDFDDVLKTLVSNAASSYRIDEARVELTIHCVPLKLSISAAIPCGLIVNELITNALKHAFPGARRGEIIVRLSVDDSQATLSVSDNGVGIPRDINLDNTRSLGLELIAILTDQLNGTLSIERAEPTRFSVRFPLDRE